LQSPNTLIQIEYAFGWMKDEIFKKYATTTTTKDKLKQFILAD
jgi:hypothetical protein